MSYMKNLMINKMNEERQARLHALSLLEEADIETLHQMFLFLHEEKIIKYHIFGILSINTNESIKDFVEFFSEPKRSLSDEKRKIQ